MEVSLDEMKGVSLNIPRNVSAFHLINWIFAIRYPLTQNQLNRIQAMYGQPKKIINPVVNTIEEFHKTMSVIMTTNKLCNIKIVVDETMLDQILFASKNYNNILDIYEYQPKYVKIQQQNNQQTVYSYNLKETKKTNIQTSLPAYKSQINIKRKKNKTKLKVFHQFDKLLQRAEKEVEKFIKSFRTFQNSHLLVEDFDKINRYRFRLFSSINLKMSDFDQSFKIFQRFSIQQLGSLNSHLEGMNKGEIGIFKLKSNLHKYYEIAYSYIKKIIQKGIHTNLSYHEDNSEENIDKQQFFNSILSIYQEQGIFYHLLNSNLKMVGQENSKWKEVSLPFNHVYNAIKYVYKQQINKKSQFYMNPFQVFRGGRVRKSQLNQYVINAGKAFIQFYGFLSTSLSAKIVADRFVTYRNSPDGFSKQETDGKFLDEEVIFRIKINPNMRILQQKYDYLVNGYYQLGKQQKHGNKQQEVLFNALNIFKIVKISTLKIIELFTEDQIKQIKRKEQKMEGYSYCKYQECEYRLNYYQNQITVIDLQFGSFYETLLEENNFSLQKEQREAKQNYIICMNKIRKFKQFDEGDACQLTNDLQGAYLYLKSKVGKDNESYQLSKVDNKNYFTRLITVCRKLGKVNEALNCNQIAIKCYKQLNGIYLNQAYNSHYQKLFDMQLKSIEIYKEFSCHLKAQKELKDQLDLIRSKKFNEPKAKLKESQVYINQAINYYSLGMLQECINRFQKCSHEIKKTIKTYSLDDEQTCRFFQFIKNIFVKEDDIQKTCSYSEYIDMLKQRRKKELIKKHGSKQQLQKTSKLAVQMLQLTSQAVKNKKKFFKSKKQYQQFINQYNQTMSKNKLTSSMNKTKQQQKQEQIMMKITQLYRQQPQSQKYHQLFGQITQSIRLIDQYSKNNLLDNQEENFMTQLINKFKDKEIQRRVKKLTDSKYEFLNQNKREMSNLLLKCAKQINQSIFALKKQGYVQQAIPILQKRNKLAKIYLQCKQPLLAKKEINMILKSQQFQYRQIDLATAYSTKGKIHLEINQIKQAIESFNQSVILFQKAHRKEYEEDHQDLDVSAVTVNNISHKQQQVKVDERYLHHNNHYLQSRILKNKALLMWLEKSKGQHKKTKFAHIFQTYNQKKPWYTRDSTSLIDEVKRQILQIRKIIRNRSKLQDLDQLKCMLLELEFEYTLNLPEANQNLESIFEIFDQCIILQTKSNILKASLTCCQFILRYYKRQNLIKLFMQKGYIRYLHKVEEEFISCSFNWKIFKALYLVQYQQEGKDTSKGVEYLSKAIGQLKKMKSQTKNSKYIENQIKKLKLKKSRQSQYLQPIQNVSFEQAQHEYLMRLAINRQSKISIQPTTYTLQTSFNLQSNNYQSNQLRDSFDFNQLPAQSNIFKSTKIDEYCINKIIIKPMQIQQAVNPQRKQDDQIFQMDQPLKIRLKNNIKKLQLKKLRASYDK